jgi:hypothetical protein
MFNIINKYLRPLYLKQQKITYVYTLNKMDITQLVGLYPYVMGKAKNNTTNNDNLK